jgi:hypothetical protein
VALRDGYCDAVDFLTPVNDPAFYQGVETRPGHLAAGLIAERPEARRPVLEALETQGAALIVGPSGAGKSALMWEAARTAPHTLVGAESYTDYLQRARILLGQLAPALERNIDGLLRGGKEPPANNLERLGEVHEAY